MEANEATQTHCYNPVAPAYPVWAYYVHGRQCRCQEDPVRLASGRLQKTPRSSLRHVAEHHPTGSETAPPYTPQSSRFGSELPSVEDDVDVWRYAILELHARSDDDNIQNELFDTEEQCDGTETKHSECNALPRKPFKETRRRTKPFKLLLK